ncbi:MAG: methionyl-tRNA formyltransferase [Oscillospiraceae bacterium]|jgi:methionyl-tRNA formyltransferase|nr:methionyl-tRNA formyltransferase [Oscillospiraceae bacterium]
MRILFMGTPDFAVCSLAALLDAGMDVCGVFTQPDKPAGRGMALAAPPVKALALSRGVPVFQPPKLRDGTALALIRELAPQLIAVVAYGRILPKEILEFPALGCVNIHASLLPKYRGAAPIQWAIARGETETGVTAQYMAEELDAGDIILSAKTPVGADETASELHDRLKELGAAALIDAVRLIGRGTAARTPQDADAATFAPILKKEDGVIDVSRPAREVYNRIRGFTLWPGAALNGLRVWKAGLVTEGIVDNTCIVCGDGGAVRLIEVQPPGGKRMGIDAYLRGHKL